MEFTRLRILVIFLILLLLYMQYRLWMEPEGLLDMFRLKKQLTIEAQKNDQLKKRNQELVIQIKQLQKNQDAIESKARQELGMVKKGETFYQVVE